MERKEQLIQQLQEEAKTSKQFIEVFPFDQKDFKVHEKSMSAYNIFLHVIELPLWAEMTVTTSELDFEKNPYNPKDLSTKEEALAYFDECVAKGVAALESAEDSEFDKPWTLRSGDMIFSTRPKEAVIRMAHNQTVHHRAQLGVNYRLLGIPVPQSYGPTADFPNFG